MADTIPANAVQEVLDFWFLAPDAPEYLQPRDVWFRKDAQFDALVGQRFAALVRLALEGGLADWRDAGPAAALARILLLDQFTRNIGRDTPAAFAGDAQALSDARAMLAAGADRQLAPQQRAFVYLPLMHTEDLATQERCVALHVALCDADPACAPSLDFAQRHRQVICQFGRFPHRNRILGRASTAQELAYLAQPGAGF